MSEGIPLSDADRAPWLESLQDAIRERLDGGEDVAVSCSALQLRYRDVLRAADRGYSYRPGEYAACRVKFVCLRASAEVIAERMLRRSAEGKHFMPASLLRSQLDLLQVDAAEGVTEFDATTVRPGDIVRDTVALFREDLASTVHA
jgi:gluconokinase